MSKTILILGPTGGVGYETAKALLKRGWRVRAMHRRPDKAQGLLPQAEWVRGDAMRRDDVIAAAQGADVILHGVNPPGYKNWPRLAPGMLAGAIAAAEETGAHIAFPGTVYNYGADAFPLLREDAPQNPWTRKGKIRVAMERMLEEAAHRGVRCVIVRAGDFFGPHSTGNSWFAQGLVKRGAPLKSVAYPGKRDVAHAWAYLPDVGETFAQLLDREDSLAPFARFHMRGHTFKRGVEIAERIRAVAGDATMPIRAIPWPLILALSPFVPVLREMSEMRYLWNTEVLLDNTKLTRFLGAEPHTATDKAIAQTLAGLGCLPQTTQNHAEYSTA